MIDIQGRYSFLFRIQNMFLNKEIKITRHNLITTFGESFFMNRCINDAFNPIEYIVVGTANNMPTKDDVSLGNETSRKRCNCKADLNKKRLILNAKFKAKDILGTSEIGVANDKILISHDRYPKYTNDQLIGFSGDVDVEYIFQFTTGYEKSEFTIVSGNEGLYYIPEENFVIGVIEAGNNGYHNTNSLEELAGHRGAYYYDFDSKNLYINPLSSDSLNREIIIQTR